MNPRRFELVPEMAPNVTVHVDDDRETAHPDEDLIEIGITADDPSGFAIAVALSVDEVARLRDALTDTIDTSFS